MSRTKLLQGLPLHKSGVNVGRLDRVAASKMLSISMKDLSKAYNNWIQVFRYEESTLTFLEYLEKMKEVGILPSDIGNSEGQYNLSRIGDEGPYTKESCRFIPRKENFYEQFENGKLISFGYGPLASIGRARNF